MPLIFGFVELVAGVLFLTSGITTASFAQILKGQAGQVYDQNQASSASTSTPSATGAATPSTLAGGNNPRGTTIKGVPSLSYGVALTGAAATTWATAILTALGAPASSANVASMKAWFEHEGGGGANNPMNTTLSTQGVTGSFGVGVKDYATPQDGIEATVKTLENGYPAIVSALRAGEGLAGNSPGVASELSTWSGGGYSSL